MNFIPRLILAISISGVIAGCASVHAEQPDEAPPTTVAMQPEPEAAAEMTATLPEPIQPNNCLECHSDAELLQQLAEEEEVAPSLSEGSG